MPTAETHITQAPEALDRNACADADLRFEELFRQHQDDVRLQVRQIVRDEAAAEDVAQEVFIKVWERADQWRGEGSFRSWLMRIATNQSLTHLRKKQRRREEDLDQALRESHEEWLVEQADAPDVLVERDEERRLVRQIVADLPEDKREAIRLVYDAEVDLRQAAEQMGIPEGTVKSRLYHGRRQVARAWKNLAEE